MRIIELLKKHGVKLIFGLLLVLTIFIASSAKAIFIPTNFDSLGSNFSSGFSSGFNSLPLGGSSSSSFLNDIAKYVATAQTAIGVLKIAGVDSDFLNKLSEVANQFANLPGLIFALNNTGTSSIEDWAKTLGIDSGALKSALAAVNKLPKSDRDFLSDSAVQGFNDGLEQTAKGLIDKKASVDNLADQYATIAKSTTSLADTKSIPGVDDIVLQEVKNQGTISDFGLTAAQIDQYTKINDQVAQQIVVAINDRQNGPWLRLVNLVATPALAAGPGASVDSTAASAIAIGTTTGGAGGIAGSDKWVINPELTAAMQGAQRAVDFLGWSFTMSNPAGGSSNTDVTNQSSSAVSDNLRSILQGLWTSTFKLVLIVYVAIIIVLAFGFITKANWLDRYRRYIPWLAISLVAAAFSFIIALFIMNLFDKGIAGVIGTTNSDQLINIANSKITTPLLSDPQILSVDSVNNTVTLLKTLSWTAYALGVIMVVRTVILWLLIIVVPLIFPFIAFPVTQALGKIWLREFIRWLFYGLLVALFLLASIKLFGVITKQTKLPAGQSDTNYDTVTNIKLDLPGTNTSVKSATTYSQYIATIIMLWISIILPWFLMRFAISFTSQEAKKWYGRNRENPRLQQILKAMTPPSRTTGLAGVAGAPGQKGAGQAYQPPLRQIVTDEKERIVAPATPLAATQTSRPAQEPYLPEGIVKPPPSPPPIGETERDLVRPTETLEHMPPSTAIAAAGYTQLDSVAKRIENSQKEGAPLQELARLEQEPYEQAQVAAEINSLRNPDLIANETKREQTRDIKNNILMAGGGAQARGIASLIRNDASHIASQSVPKELTKKNIETVKNNIQTVLGSGSVKSETTKQQLQDISSTINHYQSTPEGKAGERHAIESQIEKMVKGVIGAQTEGNLHAFEKHIARMVPSTGTAQQPATKPSAAPSGGYAPATQVGPTASELKQIEGGDELVKSMEILNAGEIAATTTSGTEALANEDIGKTVADKKTNDDFTKTKAQWIDYYKTTPVPTTDKIKNRADWIKEQIREQDDALKQINTGDIEARKKALSRLEKILPFLMLGHYSLLDVTIYLKAKIAAADAVLDELEKPTAGPPTDQQPKTDATANNAEVKEMPEIPPSQTNPPTQPPEPSTPSSPTDISSSAPISTPDEIAKFE